MPPAPTIGNTIAPPRFLVYLALFAGFFFDLFLLALTIKVLGAR